MKKILHLSDFHITLDMGQPQNNTVITSLVQKLKTVEKKINVIVYTGDLIDSKSIGKIIENLDESEKAVAWDNYAEKSYKLASDYLSYIRDELGVDYGNVVVCCGNHDVNRNVKNSKKIECDIRDIYTSNEKFLQFNKFCDIMKLSNCSSDVCFKSIEGFNFLIANSNIIDQKQSGLCINCKAIDEMLNDKIDLLENNIKENKKEYNIFISHSPQSDFCENFKYSYPENKYESRLEKLNKYFGCMFAGDKHSNSVTGSEFLMGAPLCEEQITYGIYELKPNAKIVYKKIRFSKNEWNIYESDEVMDQILKESICYLKDSGVNVLYGFHNIDLEDSIKNFIDNKRTPRWKNINSLFKSYVTLQKPRPGQSGVEIEMGEEVIDHIINLINESTRTYPVIFRGIPKIGKSLLLTIIYIGMMSGFLNNTFKYIPMYFDMDKFLANTNKNQHNVDKIKKDILAFLEKGKVLSQTYTKPVCYIIDGMYKYSFDDECLEDFLIENMSEYEVYEGYENKIIYSVDSDSGLSQPTTKVHKQKKAEHILYFNPIITNKIQNDKKYISFVDAFAKLYNCDDPNVIRENIKNLHFQYIDLNSLLNFKEYLQTKDGNCCRTEIYRELSEKFIEERYIKSVSEICYELYYRDVLYSNIIERFELDTKNVINILRKQVNLRNYLIANHYVESMKEALNKKLDDIPENSVLNECFGFEISSFIHGIIEKSSCAALFASFEKEYYDKLSFKGKSMLTYLCGRLKYNQQKLKKLLQEEKNILEQAEVDDSDESKFFSLVANRSITISYITGVTKSDDCKSKYLESLISNSDVRKVNRQFYLLYYGDREIGQIPFNNEILEGFDFYNVYHTLSTRLNEWFEKGTKNKILDIELFTLCDLIQQRIDESIAYSKSDDVKIVKSFFYDEKHNRPTSDRAFDILTFMTKIINKYLTSFETNDQNDIFKIYLHEKEKEFNSALCKIKDGKLGEADKYDSSLLIKKCSHLSKVEKIGWKIPDDITTINKELYDSYNSNKSFETVLEHIYECYLIGLLYLPLNFDDDNYNKQKILNMLLIHDLGECYTEDYPPFYDKIDEIRSEESIFNKGLFVNGVHSDIADLTEYLQLWKEWELDRDDINIKIAKEIDKIHMIYKMLRLINETDIILKEGRIKKFFAEKRNIKTELGKKIYDIIITSNKDFVELIKLYN